MNDRQRLEAILRIVCKYLPPDGISIQEAMNEIIPIVDLMPEKSEWVYLEREEIEDIWNNGCHRDDPMHAEQLFARAIEAKIKEKNTCTPKQYTDLCGND